MKEGIHLPKGISFVLVVEVLWEGTSPGSFIGDEVHSHWYLSKTNANKSYEWN